MSRPIWKICTDKPFKNVQLIFPTQQKDIAELVELARKDKNIIRVIIFGSSVSKRCKPYSDIDIYYELEEDKPITFCDITHPLDRWSNFMVDKGLKDEILNTGVVVYDRDLS